MSLNKVLLIGNVGKDPEVRYLDGNSKVARFTLATTERYKDRNGELKENTEWHNLVCWRNNADVAEKFIKKGTQIYAEGRIRTDNWTDQTGNKRYTTEIVVDNLQLLGRRSDNPGAQDGASQAYGQPSYGQPRPAQSFGSAAQPAPQAPAYSQPQGFASQAAPQPAPQPAPAPQESPVNFGGPAEGDDDLPF